MSWGSSAFYLRSLNDTFFVVKTFWRHSKEPQYCCGFRAAIHQIPQTDGVRPGTLLSYGLVKDLLPQLQELLLQITKKVTDSKMRKKPWNCCYYLKREKDEGCVVQQQTFKEKQTEKLVACGHASRQRQARSFLFLISRIWTSVKRLGPHWMRRGFSDQTMQCSLLTSTKAKNRLKRPWNLDESHEPYPYILCCLAIPADFEKHLLHNCLGQF